MTNLKPEERAREWIDRKLEDAGWKVINRDEYAPGMTAVAVREAAMRGGLEADYLLLINGKAAAVLEAKREEISLSNPHLIAQAENYTKQVKPWYPTWVLPLPFVYLSNGKEIAFKDCLKPNAKYEIITKFPRPWDLVRRLQLGEFDGLPYLSPKGLRKCQYEAVNNLEASFKEGKRRAVMVLATGSGKTFTACMMAYRMLSFTPMKHVLFLVDRNNLGTAAATELKTFKLTESGKPLSEIFWVEQLTNRPIDPRTRIVVSTIQRLYSLLTGNTDSYSEEDEDTGMGHHEGDVVELPANPTLPPDFFDLIIIDECHQESMEAYADYAVRLFQSGIFTNIKLIKQIIRAKTMELGYSVKDKYKSMYWDIRNWKYSDLITYDIQYFMRVKLITAEHMKPEEVVPVIMFLFPDADEFINNVGKTEQLIIDRTCPVCDRNYCTTKYAEKIGYRCPNCELKIPLQDRFRQYINNLDKEYIPQEDMTSMNKPVKMFHEKCGEIISIKPRAFLFEGVRCMCEHVLTEKEVIKKINSYDYFNFMSYDNDNDSVRIYCEVCHHFFKCNYHKFLKSPRCKVCNTRRMTAEIFEERVYNTVGDEYTIIKSFVDQKTKVVIRHELCGNIQEYKPSHFLDGQRCKYCGKESKSWEDSLKLLAEYKKETGNTNVPKRDEYKGESLGRWVQSQRTRFRDGKLTERQIQRLKDVGFEFDPLEAEWLRKYALYEEYVNETGKTDISKRTDFKGEHLGVWINTQLKNYREGKLSDKRIEFLKKTGLIE